MGQKNNAVNSPRSITEESLQIFEEIGKQNGVGLALMQLGAGVRREGNLAGLTRRTRKAQRF